MDVELKKNNRGFTFMELMVALGIFTIVLLAIAGMQIAAIRANSFANNMSTAVILAQDKMEELKRLAYNHSQLTDDGDANDLLDIENPDHQEHLDRGYIRVWNISDNNPVNGTKTVAVIVGWRNWRHKVEIQTIIAR